MLKESIRMSLQNIRGNKMRTFLTMLGIIIGVTAIIALITTVGSATGEITSQFSALGAGKVSVSISGTAIKHGLNESDLAHIAALDNVAGVDPNVSLRTYAAQDGQLVEDVTLEGRSSDYFSAQDDLIGRGRALKAIDMDRSSHVCIIDQTLASAAFPNEDPLGQSLILHGQQFTVVGVLSEDSGNDLLAAMSASSDGGKAIIPYPAAMRLSGSNTVRSLTLYLKDSSLSSETVDNVKQLLDSAFNYRDSAYSIINLDSLLDTMNSITGMMTTMLAGIASIALLVGGIGIMNMMLVSVSERTTEIGLRKALGARPGLIQMQFLMESVMLSLMGGFIGILVGNLVSWMIAMALDITFQLNAGAITLAFVFSASVGILFGWAPARKASRLNPIDALRSM